MYDIPNLMEICSTHILSKLQHSNVFEIAAFAFLYQDNCPIFERCMKYVCSNADEIIKEPSFMDLDEKLLCEVIKRDDLCIREEDLLNAVSHLFTLS